MNISFSKYQSLPDELHPGRVYFTNNGIFVAESNDKVNQYSSCKSLIEFTDNVIQLLPNSYYRKINQSSTITITLSPETDPTILNEYFIEFTTASTGTTVMLPSAIKWANGEAPTFDNSTTYQISIVNNLGVCIKFS
jgi:hypothetical protein